MQPEQKSPDNSEDHHAFAIGSYARLRGSSSTPGNGKIVQIIGYNANKMTWNVRINETEFGTVWTEVKDENLEAMDEESESTENPGSEQKGKNHCKSWTASDEELLLQLRDQGMTAEQIAKKLKRTPDAIKSKWQKLKDNSREFQLSKQPYIPYSTVPYPQNLHPSIVGDFWSCCCTKDIEIGDDLVLCAECNKTLSHKDCVVGLNEQCPRCKYYVNWKEQEQDEDREWTEEDNIRLIVLCSEGLSRHTIAKSLNKQQTEIDAKIKELMDDGRVRYNGKKLRKSKKRSNRHKRKRSKIHASKKSKRRVRPNVFWSNGDDELLMKLVNDRVAHNEFLNKVQDFRAIHAKFKRRADYKGRSAEALKQHHEILTGKRSRKRKRDQSNGEVEEDPSLSDSEDSDDIESSSNSANDNRKKRKLNGEPTNILSWSCVHCKSENNGTRSDESECKMCKKLQGNIEGMKVRKWLTHKVGLPQYFDLFMKEGFDDMDTIENTLTNDDLIDIGIKKRGHRNKIILFVKRLKEN